MTVSPHPTFLLCCRCSTATLADEAMGWHALRVPLGPALDICPRCAAVLLRVLRQTPDILEDAPCR